MAKKQIEVFLKPLAERQITAIAIYIEEKGYPFTAEKFAENLYSFAESLSAFPKKFPLCRNTMLAKRNYRCAVFKKKYIFVYKIAGTQVTVFKVIHATRLK